MNRDELGLFERSRGLGSLGSSIPIVVLVDQPERTWIVAALRHGVKAILPRNASSAKILWAIQAANSALFLFDDDAAQQLTPRFGSGTQTEWSELVEELTEREIEILRKLAEGLGNKQIASKPGNFRAYRQVHISSILDKLGALSRTEAVTIGIRLGLLLL